ncbi:hypothetical protein BT96DRAFT_977262 [Gymnopus androsaceus JB14]|uniref:histidine kinase n=1 Tax=Gymnopus androsaceus JB14 TaxID=1447944 RepID=A0A6A4HEF7_9AGAR|nr:hypothetical protein BT96DRAFT_977262 [Gymnopus androsaceus JB14]
MDFEMKLEEETLPLPVTNSSTRPSPRLVQFITEVVETIRTNLTAGTPPSSSSSYDDDEPPLPSLDDAVNGDFIGTVSESQGGYVEKVVVEQSWGSGSRQLTSDSSDPENPEHKSAGTQPIQIMTHEETDIPHNAFLVGLFRFWLKIKDFFYPRPFDVGSEKRYNDDDWYSKKTMAQTAAIWLILNFILAIPSVPKPWTLIDLIFYAGMAPGITLPVFVMIMYNWPRDRPVLYQCYVALALWMWPYILIININICAFYVPHNAGALLSCNGKDFINTFFYATAMQCIGLFGLRLDRLPAALAAASWFVVSCAIIIPEHHSWWRSMINFAVFHVFLIWVHERRESSERRLYAMKIQVKIQYKSIFISSTLVSWRLGLILARWLGFVLAFILTSRRSGSYVFHEVRVPLNSALLAAQSMEASGTLSKSLEVEFDALMGSLTMMSQVLNDVLDFNRLDSGQFELVSKPYAFHQTLRSLFIPLQLATAQKGLTLETELDTNIDRVARCAAYRAMGEKEDVIQRHLAEYPDVDGVVIGDEARFRQIITNFASNACKFTPAGGSVTVKTKLVVPSDLNDTGNGSKGSGSGNNHNHDAEASARLSASRLAQHDYDHGNDKDETIIVRVEVTDTGCGIEGSELTGPKLFSAFNQTDTGKQQGGKGTGLGLALVRNIVKLSGGRLGVKSRHNRGSTFWVELPLGVGRKALIPSAGIKVSESEGSMSSDIAKVRAAACESEFSSRPNSSNPVHLSTSNTLASVVDVAALKASEMSSVMRSSDLMHSTIMEQAGRVDLVVDSNTPSVPLASIRASPSIMSASNPGSLLISGAPSPITDAAFSFRSQPRGTPQSETSQNFSLSSSGYGGYGGGSVGGSGGGAEMIGYATLSENDSQVTQEQEGDPPPASLNSQVTMTQPPPDPEEEPPPMANSIKNTNPATVVQRPTRIPMPTAPAFKLSNPSSTTDHSQSSKSSLSMFDSSFSRTNGYNNSSHNLHSRNDSTPDFTPGLSVLVVDDDGITRMMMERILKRLGCEVTLAENGRVALELILGNDWDPGILEDIGEPRGERLKEGSRTHSRTMSLADSATDTSSADPSRATFVDTERRNSGLENTNVSRNIAKLGTDDTAGAIKICFGLRTVEVLRRLKRRDFVVGLTGNALLPDQDEYLQAGVDIVLTKPVMQSKIIYVLKEGDARRQHQHSLLQKTDPPSS